jgi:uncharacterized protein (TIGR03000 family)
MYAYLLSAVLGVTALGLGSGQLSAAQNEGAPATIIVSLPADATLTIDGMLTKSTSATRVFVTPPLADGNYSYTFKADFLREGKAVTVQQKVAVRPGRETVVSLDVPGQAGVGSPNYRALYPAESTNDRYPPRFNHSGPAR